MENGLNKGMFRKEQLTKSFGEELSKCFTTTMKIRQLLFSINTVTNLDEKRESIRNLLIQHQYICDHFPLCSLLTKEAKTELFTKIQMAEKPAFEQIKVLIDAAEIDTSIRCHFENIYSKTIMDETCFTRIGFFAAREIIQLIVDNISLLENTFLEAMHNSHIWEERLSIYLSQIFMDCSDLNGRLLQYFNFIAGGKKYFLFELPNNMLFTGDVAEELNTLIQTNKINEETKEALIRYFLEYQSLAQKNFSEQQNYKAE
jgi:hypothetical protein